MLFKYTIPILYSADVRRSLSYYVDVLGFERRWEWDDPPSFGGVSRGGVELFFCKEYQGHPGTWIYVVMDEVDAYRDLIKAKGADIAAEPQNMDWGMREMLVRDPDGHIIRFSQNAPPKEGQENSCAFPADMVRIVERKPSVQEFAHLLQAMEPGEPQEEERLTRLLAAAIYGVTAEETAGGSAIGCALLTGDNAGFYYVKDLMVRPDWRGKQIGTTLMEKLTQWTDQHLPGKSSVWLHAPERLGKFYRQFGFAPAFGMWRETKGGAPDQ